MEEKVLPVARTHITTALRMEKISLVKWRIESTVQLFSFSSMATIKAISNDEYLAFLIFIRIVQQVSNKDTLS